jgi:7-cyano-7-deazaguanine reductase
MPIAEGKTFDFADISHIKSEILETFGFDCPEELIVIETFEFTAVCPFSGLPDYGKLTIRYYPRGNVCIELKSLKYFVISFRNVGVYQEKATQIIYNTLRQILKLKNGDIIVCTDYNVRGGFHTVCSLGKLSLTTEV